MSLTTAMGTMHRPGGHFLTTCTVKACHTRGMHFSPHAHDGSGDPQLPLTQLLDERFLAGWSLFAGTEEGLDAELRWVLPLGSALAHAGSLSGVAVFAEAGEAQAALARADELALTGAVALVVAGLENIGATPAGTFPVVAVSRNIDFLTFSRLAGERILSQEAHVRRYAMQVHDRIAGLLHRGADLNSLVREVAAAAGHDAAIIDTRNRVIAHAMGGTRQEKSRAIGALQAHFAATEQLGAHSLREERLYVVTPESTPPPLNPISLVAWRIQMGPSPEGWVVLMPGAGRTAFTRHNLAQTKVLLEQSSSIVATELVRQRSIVEAQERARGDFMQALVHGTYANKSELAARAEHHQFPLDSQYTVFVSHTGYGESSSNVAAQVSRRLSQSLGRDGVQQVFATLLGGIIVVIRATPRSAGGGRRELETVPGSAAFAKAVAEVLAGELGKAVAVCHGSTALDAFTIRESYREARIALEIADSLGLTGGVAHDDIQAVSVLSSIAGSAHAVRFVNRILGPLRRHELAEELESTLEAFLGSGGNVNETARRVHVHRNTMLARIEKLSKLLGLDVRKPDNQFAIRLALHLDSLGNAREKIAHEIEPPEFRTAPAAISR